MENKENNKAVIWVLLVLAVTAILVYGIWVKKGGSEQTNTPQTAQNQEQTPVTSGTEELPKQEVKNETKNMTDIKEFSFDVLKQGSGQQAKAGNTVSVEYKGMFLNGTVFDAGEFAFTLGAGQVVPGFDKGVDAMKVGESRKIYIPSEMGYGARGAGSVIPPNTDLVFEVTLKSIN